MRVPDPLPVRILTHNIRYATSRPFKGEEFWEVRKAGLIYELRFQTLHNPESLICLQEVLHKQLVDILQGLNRDPSKADEWAYLGVGRDDGEKAGEYAPIFYRPAVWECLKFKTVWLSETPEKPSKSWDAASTRILTCALLRHRASWKTVLAMNTHFDDQGSRSRYEAANIVLKEVNKVNTTTTAVFLAGDLNSKPYQEAYQLLNGPSSPLADLKLLAPSHCQGGHQMTFTGFGHGKDLTRIDFIHINSPSTGPDGSNGMPQDPWMISSYAVLENRFDDGVWISDHRAVVGDLLLKN